MTPQEYISTHAPQFAAQRKGYNANALCKEIQTLCGCTLKEVIKTLVATFDEALKIRENKQ